VALDVRAAQGTTKAKGVYCYKSEITSEKAHYKGVCMSWERWQWEIKWILDNGRYELQEIPTEKQAEYKESVINRAIIASFYQNNTYLTLPKAEIDKI
jgi:hypothetical protein